MPLIQQLTSGLPRRVSYTMRDLRVDVLSGAAASGVVLPVTMGFGVMSGLGAVAGLYGSVAVGIFASLFGGTRGMIYGPNILIAITMALVVAEYADSLAEAATTAILAGLMQIIFGLLGLGRYAAYIPSSLTSGFFTAFGILLIVNQGLIALGWTPASADLLDSLVALPDAAANANIDALSLTVICIAISLVWRGPLARLSPAPFVVLGVGIVAGSLWFNGAPTIGEIPSGLPPIHVSAISVDFFLEVLQPAFVMALLASIATFMTAVRIDAVTGSQHRPTREMLGQGVGNIATGLIGGLAGSTTSGTFVNAYSGGRSPVAGVTCALMLLAVLLFLGPVAERIPLAVLAAIVILIAWSIIDWRFLLRIHRIPRGYAVVMLLTSLLVLFADLVTAVMVGLVVAAFAGSRRVESLETAALVSVPLLDRTVLEDKWDPDSDPFQAHTGLVVFPDRATIASARELSRVLRPDIRGHQYSIFDLSRTSYIDDSAAVIISELVSVALDRHTRTIIIAGMNQEVSDTMHSMGLLDKVPKGNYASDVEQAKLIIRPLLLDELSK